MAGEHISDRQRDILVAVCRRYVLTVKPVASGALVRAGLEWSSATIRNELAALERLGLVHKTHSASGRVPSAAGWQVYVESLPRSDARPEHQRLVDASLGAGGRIELAGGGGPGLRATARVLAEICGCVAIGFVGDPRTGIVEGVEIAPISQDRALVTLGFDDGSSSVRTVRLDAALLDGGAELRRLQGLLRELTIGRSLDDAGFALRERLDAQAERLDHLVAEALRIGLLLCVASYDPLWMQVAGQSSLLRDGPEAESGGESLTEVMTLLEDYQRLAELLCQILPEPSDDPEAFIKVDVGSLAGPGLRPSLVGVTFNNRDSAASGLTLVGCRLRSARVTGRAHSTGALALLGSPRMDYEAVIPLVEYAARAMAARS